MNNVKLIFLTLIVITFSSVANTNLEQRNSQQQHGFEQAEFEIDGCIFIGSECKRIREISSLASCGSVDLLSAKTAEDLVSCGSGNPDSTQAYFRNSTGDINNFGHYCVSGNDKRWCHRQQLIAEPSCGEIPSTCESGNPSDRIDFNDSFIWSCNNDSKTSLCLADKSDFLPVCAPRTQSIYVSEGPAGFYQEPNCNNGTVENVGFNTYQCLNEYGSVNCDYAPQQDPIQAQSAKCGFSEGTCVRGTPRLLRTHVYQCVTSSESSGRITSHGDRVNCEYTPPVCGSNEGTCDTGINVNGSGSFIINGDKKIWNCKTRYGTGRSATEVERECYKSIPNDLNCPAGYQYNYDTRSSEDNSAFCESLATRTPSATASSPATVLIRNSGWNSNQGACNVTYYNKGCVQPPENCCPDGTEQMGNQCIDPNGNPVGSAMCH